MRDRALDESVSPDAFCVLQGMQPFLVASATALEFTPRETSRETTERIEPRMIVERRALEPEPIAMHPIISIHSRDDRGSAERNAPVQRRDQPFMESCLDAKTRVAGCEGVGDLEGSIGRAVIDEHAFPVGFGLANQASQTHGQRRFCIPDR